MKNNDIYNLSRFLIAQEKENMYEIALSEMSSGRKRSHWMWYIFPQLVGLGRSHKANYYGISGIDEAKAYLTHSILAARLYEASSCLIELTIDNLTSVFGKTDTMKLKSSMTLFKAADPSNPVFKAVLDKFFSGKQCERTLTLLVLKMDEKMGGYN